jgi:SAM-dependent methyltransferase
MQKTIRDLASTIKFNSSRRYLYEFVRQAAESLPPDALMLDAGAGQNPYKHLFDHVRYESTDFLKVDKAYGEVSYVCDLSSIPVGAERYELVLLTQVLEHLPEPRLVLRELHRILKPGGMLWLSAPLFFAEHEVPYDYYRYTQFGFRHLLQSSGFRVERIEWLEGYYGTLSYQLEAAAKSLPIHPAQYGGGAVGGVASLGSLLLKPSFYALSLAYAHLDQQHKFVAGGLCKNYAVVARKEG